MLEYHNESFNLKENVVGIPSTPFKNNTARLASDEV